MAPSVLLAEGLVRGSQDPPPMSFYYKKSNYCNVLGVTLKQTLAHVKPSTLIDVGTFRGDIINNILAFRHPLKRIVGFDLSHESLKNASKLVEMSCRELDVNPTLEWQQGSVTSLPYGDKEFDLLTSHGCLIHLNHQEVATALSECLRVAKHCFFVESSCDDQDAKTVVSPVRTKRYWEMRARYYSTEMMHGRLKKCIESTPYYYSHDYPKLFRVLKAKVVETVCISETMHTSGYLVKGGSHGR